MASVALAGTGRGIQAIDAFDLERDVVQAARDRLPTEPKWCGDRRLGDYTAVGAAERHHVSNPHWPARKLGGSALLLVGLRLSLA